MACGGYVPQAAQHSRNYHKEALRTVYRRRLEHLGLKLQQLELGCQDAEGIPGEGAPSGNLPGSVLLPGATLLPSEFQKAAKADLLLNEISSLHEERRDLRQQVEVADLNGTVEAREAATALEGARSRVLEAQLRRDRLRRLVKGLEGDQEPTRPVSLQETERELEIKVEALRRDTDSLGQRQQSFINELQDCRRLAAQRTAELRHAEELGSEAVARRAALQLELKLLQEKIFAVETERQDLWQKQRRLGEHFESAWEAATAEAQRHLTQLSAEVSREAGDEQGLSQAADEAEAKTAAIAAELQRKQEVLATQREQALQEAAAGANLELAAGQSAQNARGDMEHVDVWREKLERHLLHESLRAEQAELRLLEASTQGVEARSEGLQGSLAAALSKLEDLKQQLEKERQAKVGAQAAAQEAWEEVQRGQREEQRRILRSHVQVLRSWNARTRSRFRLRLRRHHPNPHHLPPHPHQHQHQHQYQHQHQHQHHPHQPHQPHPQPHADGNARGKDELKRELEGHLQWLHLHWLSWASASSRHFAPLEALSLEKATFDLRCWQQALHGLKQALQQATQAIQASDFNQEPALEASLLKANEILETVLSFFRSRANPASGAPANDTNSDSVDSWHAAKDAAAWLVRGVLEVERRAAAHAAQRAFQEGLTGSAEHLDVSENADVSHISHLSHSSAELLQKELLLEEAQEEEEEEELRHGELQLALLVARREDAELEAQKASQAAGAAKEEAAKRAVEAASTWRSQDFQQLCHKICKEMIQSLRAQFQDLRGRAAGHPEIFQQMEEIYELKQSHSAISAAQAQALGSADLLEAELQAAWVATLSAIEEVQASTKELTTDRDRCRLALDATRARTDAVEEEAASLWALRGEATSLSTAGGRWHSRLRSISEWYSAASDALHSCSDGFWRPPR